LSTAHQQDFFKLVNQNRAMLHKVCNVYGHTNADREDLFQEMVIQLWKAYPKFRGDAKFSTWLYRIALNTAISNLRKKKSRINISYPELAPLNLANEERDTEKEEKLKQMYRAIGELNDVEKAIVMLYLEDKTYEEMEEILGISNGNLRVKMNRIKDKLRQRVETQVV
jgi:RNA polymerase sigma-70 factor, ECF subfamily